MLKSVEADSLGFEVTVAHGSGKRSVACNEIVSRLAYAKTELS